ncbi:hypothetical protein N7466_009310 [Penicillium verhagenii]|uniref:uncharacterized protein n=1 Tax=Penicillium verhagenii TaxID=1562060 RepID=UPI00254535BB|nr:uncharacterized protein N7466_009310 [Penicillium verhagenii]KAJ5920984.1 hypothetical protein N7466_009310 [Penicillium verhagenii]
MSNNEKPSQGSLAAQARQITLQVGERRFVTTRSTLEYESLFFKTLLSGRWDNALPDGSYFIDADPDLFEHILRYLRRMVFPVFYDSNKGHDHSKYHALHEEAKYFQVFRLEEWLENKEYLDAVKVVHSFEVTEDPCQDILPGDMRAEYYFAGSMTRNVYVCPRGILLHRGKPERCGIRCENLKAKGFKDVFEEEPVTRFLIVKRRTVFDGKKCLNYTRM